MAWLSQDEILDKYKIQHTTLRALEGCGVLDPHPLVVRRGRRGYDLNDKLDLIFRLGRVHYLEICSANFRLLPMHRAFLYGCIVDGFDVTMKAFRCRHILDYPDTVMMTRWSMFLRRAPAAVLPFIERKTDQPDAAVDLMFQILEIKDFYNQPEQLDKDTIFNNLALRADIDGMLLAKSKIETIAQTLSSVHDYELTPQQVSEYRMAYFDTYYMGTEDIDVYIKKISLPSYTSSLLHARASQSPTEYIARRGFAVEIDVKSTFNEVMRELRKSLVGPKAGPLSQNRFRDSIRSMVQIHESQSHALSRELEKVGLEEHPDLIALKHDLEMNRQAQVSINDIPAADRDTTAAGPVAPAVSAKPAAG